MDKHSKILNNLFLMARDNDPVGSSRLAAAIVLKNRVIAYGFNQAKTHPFQAQHAKNDDAIFWHAETNVIHNALKQVSEDDLKKATLYVARAKHPENKDGWIWGNSKPCCGCSDCINKHKIKRVIYTMDDIGHYGVIV